MADLTPEKRDRGQILLIAAFIIAASFVVLALVVNSAIFTENLATRDDVAGSQDTLEYRQEVVQSVGAVVTRVNRDNSLAPAEAGNTVPDVGRQGGLQQSALGRVVDVEVTGQTLGTKIAQDVERDFSSNGSVLGSAPDWTLATDVDRTRNVQFNVTGFDDTLVGTQTVEFTLLINDSNDEWEMSIKRELLGGVFENDVELEVDPPNATAHSCERTFGDYVTIDVTGGTVDGEPCYALTQLTNGTEMWLATDVEDPYHIQFADDLEAINGTYSMIVDGTAGDPSNFATDPEMGPYTTAAVYSLDLSYSYYTSAVGYESEIRVAPGEVPP